MVAKATVMVAKATVMVMVAKATVMVAKAPLPSLSPLHPPHSDVYRYPKDATPAGAFSRTPVGFLSPFL